MKIVLSRRQLDPNRPKIEDQRIKTNFAASLFTSPLICLSSMSNRDKNQDDYQYQLNLHQLTLCVCNGLHLFGQRLTQPASKEINKSTHNHLKLYIIIPYASTGIYLAIDVLDWTSGNLLIRVKLFKLQQIQNWGFEVHQ